VTAFPPEAIARCRVRFKIKTLKVNQVIAHFTTIMEPFDERRLELEIEAEALARLGVDEFCEIIRSMPPSACRAPC
jgi:hypothetical protein